MTTEYRIYTLSGFPEGDVVHIHKGPDNSFERVATVWDSPDGWLVRNDWGRQLPGLHESRQAAIDYAIQQHEEPA